MRYKQITKGRILGLTFITLSTIFLFRLVHAADRSSPFTAGETIDPGTVSEPCGPLDANCFPSVSGAGISSLGGLTSLTQTLASSTLGTDFRITSSGSTHTFNLPTASVINRGLLSSSDWMKFNSLASTSVANSWTATQTFGNNISFGGAQLNVSTLTSGQFIKYNGTNWINTDITNSDVSGLGSLATANTISNSNWSGTALSVANGGTGATSYGQGWVYSSGGTSQLAASTSPTVAYVTATSTTATSTFAGGVVAGGSSGLIILQSGGVSIGGRTPTANLTMSSNAMNEAPTLGSELASDSGWTLGTGWSGSYADGFTHASGNTAYLEFNVSSLVVSSYYAITFTLSGTSVGGLNVEIGGATSTYAIGGASDGSGAYAVDGTYTFGAYTTSNSIPFRIVPTTDYVGTISNISIKQMTAKAKSIINISDSTGALHTDLRTGGVYGTDNLFMGYDSGGYNLSMNGSGEHNTSYGYITLQQNTTGNYNTAIGYQAMQNNTGGSYNTVIGDGALQKNGNGFRNMVYGNGAMYYSTDTHDNNAYGNGALYQCTSLGCNNNTAIGLYSLGGTTLVDNNIAIGAYAANTSASSNNTALGNYALRAATTGGNNVAIGNSSLFSGTGSNTANSVAVGYLAGYYNTGANRDTFLGAAAGRGASGSNASTDNVFLGYRAGYANTTGGKNIIIGSYTGSTNQKTNTANIIIGTNSDLPSTVSATLNIGNVLYGSNMINTGAGSVTYVPTTNGSIGIGTSTLAAKLGVMANSSDTLSNLFLIASTTTGTDLQNIFLVNSSGRVGIGTSSPYANISVSGNAGQTTPIFGISTSTSAFATSTVLLIDRNGVLSINTPGATSTITGNLYINGTMRATNSYAGDLIFANNFRFTESYASSTDLNSLTLQNQYGNPILNMDQNGNLNIKGDICSNSSQCFNRSLDTLSQNISQLASTTARQQSMTFTGLNSRIDEYSSTTDALLSSLDSRIIILESLSSTTASTTATRLGNDQSFIATITSAVKSILQSTGDLVMNTITAVEGRFTKIQSDDIHVNRSLCIGNTCVTEGQLQAFIKDSNMQASPTDKIQTEMQTESESTTINIVATSTVSTTIDTQNTSSTTETTNVDGVSSTTDSIMIKSDNVATSTVNIIQDESTTTVISPVLDEQNNVSSITESTSTNINTSVEPEPAVSPKDSPLPSEEHLSTSDSDQ